MRDEIDPHGRVNVLAEDEDGFWFNTNKSAAAKKSWKRASRWVNDVVTICACEWCGRFGNAARVRHRWDLYRVGLHGRYGDIPKLCMGCWNKARAVIRRWDALVELKAITRRLRSGKREHDDGGSAGKVA